MVQSAFIVVDEDRSGDVHGVAKHQALYDAALADGFLDLRADVHERHLRGDVERQVVREALHANPSEMASPWWILVDRFGQPCQLSLELPEIGERARIAPRAAQKATARLARNGRWPGSEMETNPPPRSRSGVGRDNLEVTHPASQGRGIAEIAPAPRATRQSSPVMGSPSPRAARSSMVRNDMFALRVRTEPSPMQTFAAPL